MAEAVAAAARTLVGAPFRLHGREAATGLDCVGVVALACGRPERTPRGYALRGGDADRFGAMLDAAGLVKVRERACGDIALVEAGPGQFHLIVLTDAGFVHADAGLRRVVERPGEVPWPVIGFWRMEGGCDGDTGADQARIGARRTAGRGDRCLYRPAD